MNQFKHAMNAERWVRARATTKRILSRYLSCAPVDVRFTYGAQGNPTVGSASGQAGPHFNLSHSEDTLLLAVSPACPVGVDIECVRSLDDLAAVARRFFSPCEFQVLMALSPATRLLGFFRCWSRKEAVIKADGAGMSLPLDAFSVSLHNETRSRVRWNDNWRGSQPPLDIIDLASDTRHAAALAVPASMQFELHWQDAQIIAKPP